MLLPVVSQKLTDVSKMLTASIIRETSRTYSLGFLDSEYDFANIA
jgi:hypothetical protein